MFCWKKGKIGHQKAIISLFFNTFYSKIRRFTPTKYSFSQFIDLPPTNYSFFPVQRIKPSTWKASMLLGKKGWRKSFVGGLDEKMRMWLGLEIVVAGLSPLVLQRLPENYRMVTVFDQITIDTLQNFWKANLSGYILEIQNILFSK